MRRASPWCNVLTASILEKLPSPGTAEKLSARAREDRGMPGQFYEVWQWLKDNDAPNWFVIFFSLLVWPVILYWISNRKGHNVPHLDVFPHMISAGIGNQQGDAVELEFANVTGSIVYLQRVRLREKRKNFPVPEVAARDISSGWRDLSLRYLSEQVYHRHECILQTNERAMCCVAVEGQLDASFHNHRSRWIRRFFRCPKYYRLEYTAMVGEKKYTVSTVY